MKNYIFSVLIVFTMFIPCIDVLSQDVTVKVYPDTSTILIGDQIKLNVQATLPNNTYIKLPFINDSIDKKIEIISQTKIDSSFLKEKSFVTISQTYTITSFDTGLYIIPPLPFYFSNDKGKTFDTLYSKPFEIRVNTINIDTTLAIKDIKGPLDAPIVIEELLPYIVGLLFLVLIIFLCIYFYRKYKKAKANNESVFKPKIPPYIKALDALEQLRLKKLWQQDKTKQYYSELSDILRTFFEEEMKFNALEMTSDEIIELLTIKLNNDIISKLKHILSTSDLVKFAKHKPLPDENELLFNFVVDIVKTTSDKNNINGSNDAISIN